MAAQYPRVLIDYVYEVEEILEGTCPAKRIVVAHWLKWDHRPVAGIAERELGTVHALTLDPIDGHPEFLRDVRVSTVDALDLPAYLDVGPDSPARAEGE
jgi:hypothetical protein